MSYDKGFDFRDTSGFVTDPSNCTYVLNTDVYPIVRNGATFGWTGTMQSRDRDATAGNEKVAGIHFVDVGTQPQTFQVDLPGSGTYNINLCVGDVDGGGAVGQVLIKDGSTTLITINHGATNLDYDANDTSFASLAAWVSGQTFKQVSFAGSTLTLVITIGSATLGCVAHLFVSQVSITDLSAFPGEPQTGSSKIQGGLR